jgi:hypothetical protein
MKQEVLNIMSELVFLLWTPCMQIASFCVVFYFYLWPVWLNHTFPQTTDREIYHTRKYSKYSGLVPPSIQQL